MNQFDMSYQYCVCQNGWSGQYCEIDDGTSEYTDIIFGIWSTLRDALNDISAVCLFLNSGVLQ